MTLTYIIWHEIASPMFIKSSHFLAIVQTDAQDALLTATGYIVQIMIEDIQLEITHLAQQNLRYFNKDEQQGASSAAENN